ncbi:hypothetical protein KY284_032944 [Solanum tuberosum]|nr:hypothetical protein KY284_032944 [Solanum tuberosum]
MPHIMENKKHSRAKVLTLKVHPPVIGAFPIVRKTLETSHHLPKWSSTKTKDVTDNFSNNVTTEKVLLLKSSTHQNVVVAIPPRQDVIARCKETLDNFKTYDAIFASMLTYDHNENVLQAFARIGVHPPIRSLHSSERVTQVDDQGKSFLPRSYSFLISAFYRLTKGAIDEVSLREWTKFWFRGPRKYVEPLLRTSKNHTKPKMNHNPSENIDMSFLPRIEEENALFIELGVEELFIDETYLAVFLACWLCKFVLPNKKVDCIHASVFKVASLMAHGEIFSLAVPVLARSIAASRIYPLLQTWGKELHIDDSGKLSTSWSDFLIGLRSSFVTLRLDDELIVEPYSPHRFSQQFGYYQDVPGALIEHHYDCSLLALMQLWDSCVHLGSITHRRTTYVITAKIFPD